MAPLSFVYSDGSAQCDNLNRKIVRSHVSKHFHPKKKGTQAQKLEPFGSQQPRLIAPNHHRLSPGNGSSNLIDHESKSEELNSLISDTLDAKVCEQNHPSALKDTINLDYEVSETSDDDFQLESTRRDGQIEPTTARGRLRSGTERNIRIGWLKEGSADVTQTKSRGANKRISGTQWRHCIPRHGKAKSVSPCPQARDLLPSRNLANPILTSASRETRQTIEQYACKVDDGARLRGLVPSELPLRNAYMPAAESHRALWHAQVAHSSFMRQIYQGIPIDAVSLKHKGETIRAINACLQDPSEQKMDETIAAVQALATIELVCKNLDAFAIHLKAIHEMVRLRGGLDALGFGGLLSWLIQMHGWRWEILAPNAQEDTIFSFIRPQPQLGIPTKLSIFTLRSPKKRARPHTGVISELLEDLQTLVLTWDTEPALAPLAASLSFENGCISLYDQVYADSLFDQSENDLTTENYEFEAFRLACLLFSSHGVENEGVRIDSRRTRVLKLQECLLQTEMARYWTEYPGALIWCLAVGVHESWEYDEYPWFMANLNPMLMMLSMECWKELEMSLNIFGWLIRCSRAGTVLPR